MNQMLQMPRATPLRVLLFSVAALLLAAGCRSPDPAISHRMAAIVVTNQPSEHIEAAIRTVFKRNGYEEGKAEDDQFVFQRPGSMMSGMVYSDWFNGGVWERIKIYQRDLTPTEIVVECDGYMVSEHEDPLFQKEKKEYATKNAHCQKLLNEVAQELKRPKD